MTKFIALQEAVYSDGVAEDHFARSGVQVYPMKPQQKSDWKALAITSFCTLLAIPCLFVDVALAKTATVRLSNATVELSDPGGPEMANGTVNHARTYRKVANIVGANGNYMGSSVALTIVGALALDEANSRFPNAPTQQRQAYTGTYRLTMIAGDGTTRMVDIDATTIAFYAPHTQSGIQIAFKGKVMGGAQPNIPAYVSGTFISRNPIRLTNSVLFDIHDVVLNFNDIETS